MRIFNQSTVGHRRRVTAVTHLPRWRWQKTWLQVRLLLTILQDIDHCHFWHANRYWIGLTCYTVIFGHYKSEWSNSTLAFSGGKQVTSSKEASDWRFGDARLTLQSQFSRAGVERSCWQQCCGKFLVAQRTTHSWRLGGPPQFWVVRQSAGTMKSIKMTNIYISECYPLDVLKQKDSIDKVLIIPSHDVWRNCPNHGKTR